MQNLASKMNTFTLSYVIREYVHLGPKNERVHAPKYPPSSQRWFYMYRYRRTQAYIHGQAGTCLRRESPPTPTARPLIANDRVNLTSYHEKFLADEVTLGQAFLQARRFSPTIIISPCPFIYIALTLRDLRN